MNLNLLDILILIPLLLFTWKGYKKGLIIEISTLAALISGLYFSFYFSDFAAGMLTSSFNIGDSYIGIISFVVTFVGVVIMVLAVGKIVEKFIDILMLGFLNKLAGALFGMLKGALYISILIFLINYLDSGRSIIKRDAAASSFLYGPVESFAPMLYSKLHLENFDVHLPDKDEVLQKVI